MRAKTIAALLFASVAACAACSGDDSAAPASDAAVAGNGAAGGAGGSAGSAGSGSMEDGGPQVAGSGGTGVDASDMLDASEPPSDGGSELDASKPGAPDPSDDRPFVGGCISAHPRLERVAGRTYLDFDDQPLDAIELLADNGFSAARLFVAYGDPLEHGAIDESNVDQREANFQLDMGGIDWQVELGQRVRAAGMRVALTIQFGQDKPVPDNWHEFIPDEWLGLTYQETVAKIDEHTRVMLKPFLDANIQPEVIIVENEADSGMLFQYLDGDGNMQIRDEASDAMSDVATGIYTIWPKSAGYFKRVILSARDEIQRAGYDPDLTRFAVHTTTNPFRVRSTFDRIFKNEDDAESVYYKDGEPQGVITAVPAELREARLRDLVDIIGFSVYPPLPTSGNQASFDEAFAQFTSDLAYMAPDIEAYGRYTSGPFKGQYTKQALVVEYSTRTDSSVGFDVVRQQAHTTDFFHKLFEYEWSMGAMWWEPTYANNNWFGHEGSLFRNTTWDDTTQTWARQAPIETLKTWGAFGRTRTGE